MSAVPLNGANPLNPGPLNRGALAAAVRSGAPTLGTFVGSASPLVAEVCAAAGVHWVLLDLEHGAGGEEQVRDVVPAAGSYGVPTVVRVESAAAVSNAEPIAGLDGVDVLFVGPRDLSHDLGVPGDLAAPRFTEAIEQVKAASQRHGKACGLLVTDGAAAARRIEQGWSFVAIGSDTTLLATAVTAEFGRARTSSQPH
jgi:2-keto-3-deoxy-L-rhamnonate aldolase RhmA